MQHSKPLSEHRGAKARYHHPASNQPSQQTVSELFASSKRRQEVAEELNSTPPLSAKRSKLNHPNPTESPSMNGPTILPPQRMYNFTSTSSRTNGVIDLTGSSDEGALLNSAKQRKSSGGKRPTNFTPHMGAKKLVVKNFRKTPRASPDQYFDGIWSQLDPSLSAIFDHEKIPFSLEELYRGVENICRQGRAPALYRKFRDRCEDNVSLGLKAPLLQNMNGRSNVEVLRSAVQAWSIWGSQLTTLRSIFYYMDRSYLLHSSSEPSIAEMGISQFRKNIFSDVTLKEKILQGTCDLIDYDRRASTESIDNDLFRDAIRMFHNLSVYTKEFEPKMLGESQGFFVQWANEQRSTKALADYVAECQALLQHENSRCDSFNLAETTRDDLIQKLETVLIEHWWLQLVNTEDVSGLLENDRRDSLRQLFDLLQRKRLGAKLRPSFEAYIIAQGSKIVFDEEHENDMVVRLLQFKKKLDAVWESCFQKHEGLGHSLREAFESFINKTKKSNMTWGTDNPKPGEMIAKYVDMILRGGAKAIPATTTSAENEQAGPNDEDLDNASGDEDSHLNKELDQVLDLFRFVHGKAVFEAFYKKDLARRLLMGRSASSDAEKSMLTRLKSECGSEFTHNLEGMFKDIELAREEISSYKTMLEDRQKTLPVDLNVNVLSASAWPTYPDFAVEIPQDIQKVLADFELNYKAKHTGRKLAWKHALAHCQLKADFPKGKKEIVVSSFQAIVMLLFNNASKPLSYPDIQAAANLSDVELKRTLQSLACARYRVLSKTPKGKEINETDTFVVNLNFSDPKYRIKINQIQLKETKEENKETHERVAADRHYETQAAVVRIMKTRKTITHAELIAEVITATKTRGVLDPADIKKNIEKLIEKEYMEREEGNSYSYLA